MTLKEFINHSPDKLFLRLVRGMEEVGPELITLVVEDLKMYDSFGDVSFLKAFPKAEQDLGMVNGVQVHTMDRVLETEAEGAYYNKKFILEIPYMDIKAGDIVMLGAFDGEQELRFL